MRLTSDWNSSPRGNQVNGSPLVISETKDHDRAKIHYVSTENQRFWHFPTIDLSLSFVLDFNRHKHFSGVIWMKRIHNRNKDIFWLSIFSKLKQLGGQIEKCRNKYKIKVKCIRLYEFAERDPGWRFPARYQWIKKLSGRDNNEESRQQNAS